MADFKLHKTQCSELKKATEKMQREERKLHEEDPYGEGDPFEFGVGHFWGIIQTRDYMRARSNVIRILEEIGSQQSLSAAVEHILGCLNLCRGDNMGVRDLVPAMMLRIGQDQECYDFIKW